MAFLFVSLVASFVATPLPRSLWSGEWQGLTDEDARKRMTKYIFVTGGVVSSVGKGITTASLGRLLRNRGFRVTLQKLDPYINVDAGTMNPYQHGEVFVTEDGAETDLDLGHYERFVDVDLTRRASVTTGSVYRTRDCQRAAGRLSGRDRADDPACFGEIKERVREAAKGVDGAAGRRRGDRRSGRHGRRHRRPDFSGSHSAVPQGRGARKT